MSSVETEVQVIISYPQRSDGQRFAELTIRDQRSRLTICEVRMTAQELMDALSSLHAGAESKATVNVSDKIGLYSEASSFEIKRTELGSKGGVPDYVRAAASERAVDGWEFSHASRTNRGTWNVTMNRYTPGGVS